MVDTTSKWEDELGRWLKPLLDRLGHKARRGCARCMLTPTVYIGKGFGDLPDSVAWLRPLTLAEAINPKILQLGFALEYSLVTNQYSGPNLHSPTRRFATTSFRTTCS
jgi:hypothetical protein